MSDRAIVFADLVGYARHVQEDEPGTLSYMTLCFSEARAEADQLGGRVVKTTGDGFVAHFATVDSAINFALEFHNAAKARRRRTFVFRIGINCGDVHVGKTDIYGHAVNIAARIEALAHPGGVAISQTAFERSGRYAEDFVGRGPVVLKNISERVPIYDYAPAVGGEKRPEILVMVVGRLAITKSDGDHIDIRSQQARNLMGILALSAPEGRLQSECAALLAGEDEDGDAELTRASRTLARAFERAGLTAALTTSEGSIALDARTVAVDLPLILEEAKAGQVDEKLARGIDWDKGLAPGLEAHGATLRSWMRVTRGRWRREAVSALEVCLERFSPKEEGARRAAEALTRIEPGHEPASQALMEHYRQAGNRAAALQEYERLRDWLKERYDIETSEQTEALVVALRRGDGAPGLNTNSLPILRPDLRVADFSAVSGKEDFAAGLKADVVAALSRFREWYVAEFDVASAGDYLLDASVDSSFVAFSLKRLADSAVLWRERLDAGAKWSNSQELLVASVAARMEVYISADRISRAFGAGASAGFDAWMRAEGMLGRWTVSAEAEAAAALEDLVAEHPEFAPAFASIASIHNVRHIVRPGLPRDDVNTARALKAAQRAVEIDTLDARSQLALAWAAAMADRFDQAVVHLDLAATLNPTSARTAVSAAMGLAFFGHSRRGQELFDRTVATVPMLASWQWCYGAPVRYFFGDLEGALEATARGGDAIDDNQGWRAVTLAELGRSEEASTAFALFKAAIEPAWEGIEPFSPVALANWFSHAYPLRRPADRDRLAAATASAAGLAQAEITGTG